MAGPLVDLAGLLFLQVKEPTRKLNILDIIFCHDDLVNYITTTDTFLSDHIYYRFIVRFLIGLDFLFITFTILLHLLLS